jgi:regulator of RNase E activity RraA
VIVIPAHIADEIATAAVEIMAYEDFVAERVHAGSGIFGLYPATDPKSLELFAAWRKKNGR